MENLNFLDVEESLYDNYKIIDGKSYYEPMPGFLMEIEKQPNPELHINSYIESEFRKIVKERYGFIKTLWQFSVAANHGAQFQTAF